MADGGPGEEQLERGERPQRLPEDVQAELAELRASRARLLLAADADRRAIERLLHDGLQQQLVALAVNLRRLSDAVIADPEAARASLDEVTALVRQAIEEAAMLAHRIHPPWLLDMRGLASALRSAAQSAEIVVTIHAPADGRATPEVIAGVYWCCAEALAAATVHTQATVTLDDDGSGLGFEVELVAAYSEGRIERMRDRVEALGGRLVVEDAGEGRSRVAGVVPSGST